MKDELLDLTMGDLLDATAARFPNNEALVYLQRENYRKTYAEFRDICNDVAKSLLTMGIGKGDHVAIWATNCPEWLILLFATAKIGAVLVTVNTSYKIYEAEYLLKQSDSKALVFIEGFKDCNYVQIMNELCPELQTCGAPSDFSSEKLPKLKRVIYIGENTYPGMYNWDELYTLGKSVPDAELAALQASLNVHEVINMQYTSGTTGFPKGVMLTHYNIVNNGKCIGDNMKFTEADRLCIPVPFFHCFGLVLAILACVTHGSTMVPVEYYQAQRVMQTVQDEKCTALHGVPTMFIGILDHPDFDKYDFSALRTGIMAGSPCPIKVMQDVVDKMGATDITIAFGLTESAPVCTQTTVDDTIERKVATVGRTMPFMETRVIDPETGLEVPNGTPGEFVVRGYNIMKGYYKMPEATANAIDKDGWLHSGDLATRDEDGYYKITGRIKDMIIRGGENIYPKEIEEFLYTLPKVKDVQVVGVPSKAYGEEIMAYIILKDGVTATEDEIKDSVRARLARHKTPKYVHFIDSFPVTASGKIQKYKLREMAIKLLGLEDEANIETA